jgi:hypothetical protein
VATVDTTTPKEYILYIDNATSEIYSFTTIGVYDPLFTSFIEDIPDVAVTKGERIYIRLKNSGAGSNPTNVSHNITLTLRPS